MNVMKTWVVVSLFAFAAVAAGCAMDDGSPEGEESELVVVEESFPEQLADESPAAAAAATNCLVVEYCNAPESIWPGTGTLCKRKSGETCNYTQEKAECVADAKYVCGAVTYPYAIYNN